MTAELLGRISARSAFAKTVIAATWGGTSPSHALPAPVPSPRRRFTGRTVLSGERGFTMTELMVTVGIVAILSAVAAPPLMATIATQQVKTATFDLYSALSYARSEAIKRNSVVTITPHDGVFTNGYDLAAGASILRRQIGSPAVAINAPPGIALAFDGYGRLTTPTRFLLELTAVQSSATPKRCLVISPSGRASIRVDKDHDGNCING